MKLGLEIPDEDIYAQVCKILSGAALCPRPEQPGLSQQQTARLNSPWLTRDDAAEYARCSVRHINYLAERGEIKRYPGPRYKKTDIDKCIEQGRFVEHPRKANFGSSNGHSNAVSQETTKQGSDLAQAAPDSLTP